MIIWNTRESETAFSPVYTESLTGLLTGRCRPLKDAKIRHQICNWNAQSIISIRYTAVHLIFSWRSSAAVSLFEYWQHDANAWTAPDTQLSPYTVCILVVYRKH